MASFTGANASIKGTKRLNSGAVEQHDVYSFSGYNREAALALKGQLRLSYFFNSWFGISAGAYYLHAFKLPYAQRVNPSYGNMLNLDRPQEYVRAQKDMASLGVFASLSFRICAKERMLLPPPPPVQTQTESAPAPKPEPEPKLDYVLRGKVFYANTTTPIPGAKINLQNRSNEQVQEFMAGTQGEYQFTLRADNSYSIAATAPSCLPSEQKVFEKGQYDPNITPVVEHNIYLTKVEVNEAIILKNLYYDLDQATIRADARPELERLFRYLSENPEVRVEMSSHTDSRASEQYNLRLSQRRADAVKAYLVEKGIDPKRIVSVGYGETRLLNKCKDGVECSEEEHQQNRRTEMKVIQ